MIFLVVSIVIDVAEKIDDFIEKKPPLDRLIFEYYLDFILFYGNLLSPICVFLAVIFFTSRLTQNTEIVAILSSGVSFWRLLAPYIGTGIFLAGVSFYMNAFLVPRATEERINFEYEFLKTKRVMDDINIHRKVSRDEDGAETFVYIYSFNQLINEGYIFSMERVKDGDITTKINCDRINWNDSTQHWILHDCNTRYLTPTSEAIVFTKEIDTTFLLTPNDIYVREMRAESLPLNELYEYIELETERGSDIVDELILESYERWAYPFAAIVLTMIGFSVSTKKRRGGTALQLGIGLVLSFLYVTLVVAGQAMIGDAFPAWLAVWYPNILFFGLGVFLLRVAPK